MVEPAQHHKLSNGELYNSLVENAKKKSPEVTTFFNRGSEYTVPLQFNGKSYNVFVADGDDKGIERENRIPTCSIIPVGKDEKRFYICNSYFDDGIYHCQCKEKRFVIGTPDNPLFVDIPDKEKYTFKSQTESKKEYLFSFGDGNSNYNNDGDKIRWHLVNTLRIPWAKYAEITENDEGNLIQVTNNKWGKSLEIRLDKENDKAIFKTGGLTVEYQLKKKNGKLDLYKEDGVNPGESIGLIKVPLRDIAENDELSKKLIEYSRGCSGIEA